MTASQRTLVGIAMVVCGIMLALVALPIGWHACQQWFAIGEMREATMRARNNHSDESRRIAEKAASRVPDEIAQVLLAIDPTQAADLDRVQAMLPQIRRREDRAAAVATIALGRALLGVPIGVDLGDDIDAKLIQAIVELRHGKDFVLPSDSSGDASHLAVQRAAWTLALQRALELKLADPVGRVSAMLVVLFPNDPQIRVWRLLAGTCSSQSADKELVYLTEQVTDQQRKTIVRAIIDMKPDKRSVLAARWPSDVEAAP